MGKGWSQTGDSFIMKAIYLSYESLPLITREEELVLKALTRVVKSPEDIIHPSVISWKKEKNRKCF